ncbi:hypothetical protein SAMN05421803_105262 [Nocardiopsis flavescens]|uniref:Uncharacterized protein n=1 Tax=Nocardiopsis flavescens TaxID=758803 RepID=A0A1M6IQV1_9ACTN|nr:hypothetical protein SAMN05421803_105262 [Nocardiopsis flavescens]
MRSIVTGTATGGIGGWRHVVIGLAYVENVAGAQRRPVPGARNATLAPTSAVSTGAATLITEVRVPSLTTTASAAVRTSRPSAHRPPRTVAARDARGTPITSASSPAASEHLPSVRSTAAAPSSARPTPVRVGHGERR